MTDSKGQITNTARVLKQIRESRALTFTELGKLMDVSKVYVFSLENSKYSAKPEYMNKLVKKIHLKKDELTELKFSIMQDATANYDFF